MSKRKATEEGVKKATEQLLQGEAELKQYLTQIEQLAQKIGVEPRQLLLRVIETGVRVYDWGSITIPQLIICVDFLSYLDEKFYKRIYVESPIEAVIKQADKFSEATRKILEGYGAMIKVKAPQQQQEEEEEAKPKQQQQQGGVLDKMIDHVVTYIADELGARLSKDIADVVEPELKEVLINMIKEGRVRIEIVGGELLKKTEEAAAAKE
jgi:hypothetical protein